MAEYKETLIPLQDYITCAVHMGTKVVTPHMREFLYKKRGDGLVILDKMKTDKKIREAIEFLIKYQPDEIYLLCKRESGWDAVELFSHFTGIRIFTKTYTPGITTNLNLEDFFEAEVTIICDPWLDKNALNDTVKLKKPVIGLCDSNNYTKGITKVIPCNNKSNKSIGCIFFIITREYCKAKGLLFDAKLEDFTGPLDI